LTGARAPGKKSRKSPASVEDAGLFFACAVAETAWKPSIYKKIGL
jgi:hypothetical protein